MKGGPRVRYFTLGGRRFAVLALSLGELPAELTRAEREVAALLQQGFSNAEIARRRRCSPRTVANQVATLMRKLSAESRVQLTLRLGEGTKRKTP
ncbi:MAG: response regulator transcription factor [Myxococcales bacterium]